MLALIALTLIAAALTLQPVLVTLIIGALLPLLVDVATKSTATKSVKDWTLGILALAAAVIVEATTEGGAAVLEWDTLIEAAVTWLVGFVAFRRVHKPTGLSDMVESSTATFGIG